MIRSLPIHLAGFLATAGILSAQTPQPVVVHELPPLFQASQALPPGLFAGPHHRVRELAQGDGYLVHFTVDSDYGTFECVGLRDLQRRVREIEAIASLVAVSKSDLFAEGMKKSVEAPIEAVKRIVQKPGESVAQVPHTVGHFFSKIGSGIGNAARRASEGSSAGTGSSPKNVGKGIGGAVLSIAGFDKARLDCARQLGIDPYTDNPRLQEEIEKVTWAFFAGGLPLKVGVTVASAGASRALMATEVVGLPEDIYDVTPSELEFRDRKALEAMGIAPARIDAVMANRNLSITVRHRMVQSLTRLNVAGRAEIVEVMAACDTIWRAHFLRDGLHLLEVRHAARPYQACRVYGRLAVGQLADGTVEVPAPVDYVAWTPEMAAFASRDDLVQFPRRLILDGQLSQRTTTELGAAGWEIVPFRTAR